MKKQGGMMLIEVMVSMLLFAIALLALVSSKANAIKSAGDAQLRTEASYLVNQIIGQMWVDRANLGGYAHTTAGAYTNTTPPTPVDCNFTSAASALPEVTKWVGNSTTKGTVLGTLPNPAVQIDVISAATGEVRVTLCWRAPQDPLPTNSTEIDRAIHIFSTTTMIPG